MLKKYIDFEVTFQQLNGDRVPFVVDSRQGQATGELVLPAADPTFQQLLNQLHDNHTDEGMLIDLGRKLYDMLFRDGVRERFAATEGSQTEGQGIRLKLRTAQGDTAVGALPWEFLYDPNRENPFVLLDISVVRYPQAPIAETTLATKLPLKVLLTAAQPNDTGETFANRELDLISAALAERGLETDIQITEEHHLTRQKFQQLLRQGFHVWHFAGHGALSSDGRSGSLVFEDREGSSDKVSARELGVMLANRGIRLVLLDACESGRLALDSFRSIAPSLIASGTAAVVAMQFTVLEESTSAFASEFYAALAEGLPIDACVTEGRRSVMGVAGLRRPDWGIPVVYTRASDGLLFDLADKPTPVVQPTNGGVVNDFSNAQISGSVNITTGDRNIVGNTFNSSQDTQATANDDSEAHRSLTKLHQTKKQVYLILVNQIAKYGGTASAPVSALINIEDTVKEIRELEKQLGLPPDPTIRMPS